jgi:uncharacterized membrane-anchored protein YhcB (DUF1043 family)
VVLVQVVEHLDHQVKWIIRIIRNYQILTEHLGPSGKQDQVERLDQEEHLNRVRSAGSKVDQSREQVEHLIKWFNQNF